MKKRTTKTLFLSLALCTIASVGAGTALLKADAADIVTPTLSSDTFKVLGASIRIKGAEDVTGDGIRFCVGIEKSVYEANTAIKNNVRLLVMPTKLVSGTLDKGETYVKNEQTATTNDEAASGKWMLETVTVDDATAEYYCTYVYLWDIPDDFYNVNITARAYYTEDNGETASVYSTEAVRSFEYVADAALDDLKDTQDEGEDAKYKYAVTVDGVTKYSPYDEDTRTVIAGYLTEYTVTYLDGYGNPYGTPETVKYGTAVEAVEGTPDCKGDFMYWQNGSAKYDFSQEVTGNLVLTPKQTVLTATNELLTVKEENIGTNFRVETFIAFDKADLTGNKSGGSYTAQLNFTAADGTNEARFGILRWDDRIIVKNVSANVSANLFELKDNSTNEVPVYGDFATTISYSNDIAKSFIANNGLTVAIERNATVWNVYVKIGNTYYLVLENQSFSAVGSQDITKINLWSDTANVNNNSFIKNLTVVKNPTALSTICYPAPAEAYATNTNGVNVINKNYGTDFRMEVFLGQEQLDMTYNASATGELWKTRIELGSANLSKRAMFFVARYDNRIIIGEENNKIRKMYRITESGYGKHEDAGLTFSDEAIAAIAPGIVEENGVTLVIERKAANYTLYVKAGGQYYLIGTCQPGAVDGKTQLGATDAIDSIRLRAAAGGVSVTNRACLKDLMVTLNPTDTITAI